MEITYICEENNHKRQFPFVVTTTTSFPKIWKVFSLLLSALCSLSPQVVEWMAYGTLQLLSDFADFHREKLVCKVLHLSLASERTDAIEIFQVCVKYISAYMQSKGCGWREKGLLHFTP